MLSFSRIVNVSFVLPFHAYIHASLLKFLYLNKAKTSLILGHSLETTSISPLPFTPKVSQERSGQPCHVLIFLLCFPFFFIFVFCSSIFSFFLNSLLLSNPLRSGSWLNKRMKLLSAGTLMSLLNPTDNLQD